MNVMIEYCHENQTDCYCTHDIVLKLCCGSAKLLDFIMMGSSYVTSREYIIVIIYALAEIL